MIWGRSLHGKCLSAVAIASSCDMRARGPTLTAVLACSIIYSLACDSDQITRGCKIYRESCQCGTGCNTEYIFSSRGACLDALREQKSNICLRKPCRTGICIQTLQDPGFTCKCEGTGYYGLRCENACPTIPMRGLKFPHECIVI